MKRHVTCFLVYVLATFEPKMNEYKKLVQEKLFGPDTCTTCVGGATCSQARQARLIALIQSQQDFAVFVYSMTQAPPTKAEHLNLELTFPIDDSFKFNLGRYPTNQGQGSALRLSSGNTVLDIQIGQGLEYSNFCQQLQSAIHVHSQNSGFGLPSSFNWIEKYTGVPCSPAINPFLNDIFDPLAGNGNAEKNQDAWRHEIVNQNEVGNQCPVVKDDPFSMASVDKALPRTNAIPSNVMRSNVTQSSTLPGSSGSMVDFDAKTRRESLPVYSSQRSIPSLAGFVEEYYKEQDEHLHSIYEMCRSNLENEMQSAVGKTAGGRENLVRLVMNSREDDFCDRRTVTLFCGTWNTNGQSASQTLEDWLAVDEDPPDIYALGFQELDLSKNAYIFSESPKEAEWARRCHEGLHYKGKYVRLKLVRLVGMMLIVYVRRELKERVFNVMAANVGTGIMGMMGNKGGVGVRLEIDNTSICFVNTHLAAHMEEFERRNQDFRDINTKMNFLSSTLPITIQDHDFVFWLGDLNYRLDSIAYDQCLKLIQEEKYHELMNYDQLVKQIAFKRVFLDYLEGKINFKPTYRYDAGTDRFDTSEKQRKPAYCDRILWRGLDIQQHVYRSHPKLIVSDHKPVSALFTASVKKIDDTRRQATYRDVMQKLDRLENDYLPQVSLDMVEVTFKDVVFMEPRTHILQVTNTGQVPAEFEFIKKLDQNSFCKPWLNVDPYKGTIPVKGACTIQLEVYVNQRIAHTLNSGEDAFEDILVIHLEGGKDLFVAVSGNYLPSCFGSSIAGLVHTFKPIRDVNTSVLIDLEQHSSPGMTPPSPDRPLDIPKELWILMGKLRKQGIQVPDLFEQPGLHSEVQQIRDALDTGQSTLPGTVYSAVYALYLMLEAFPEPVVPYSLYTPALRVCTNFNQCKQVLGKAPVYHRNVFKYICAFLRDWHSNVAPEQRMESLEFLAKQFGTLFLRRPDDMADPSKTERLAEEKNKATFMRHFLTQPYDE